METEEEGQNQPTVVPNRIQSRRFVERDRISALPDCLLIEILSRLHSIKGAIRTGTLSKRWVRLWTFVPTLHFTCNSEDNIYPFFLFVDETLTQRGQMKLKRFRVHCRYDSRFQSKIRSWIRYAITCNVEELSLTFWNTDFVLDQSFFICSCFTDMTIGSCIFNPVGAISWKNLTILCISFAKLSEALIANIQSGSPQLASLILNDCYGYKRLDITSKSIKDLVFSGYFDPDDESDSTIIEINAPNVLSLAIRDELVLWKVLLVNVSSLVKSNLNYTNCETTSEEEMLKGFIQSFSHVKELNIWASCSKVLSRLQAKGFILPSNMKVFDVAYVWNEDD